MPTKLSHCPSCTRKGWYQTHRGYHRCRYCGHNDSVKVASSELQRTLDRASRAVSRTLDREREKGAKP